MSPGPVSSWVPLGPSGALGLAFYEEEPLPVSGRVTAIVADPADPDTKVYVGTSIGGVWRLVVAADGAQTWEPLIDAESVITVGALALSPAGDVLWIGTGDSALGGDAIVGRGILRLTLATGAIVRWYAGGNVVGLPTPPTPPLASGLPAELVVSRIAVDAGAPDHVVAATTLGIFELSGPNQAFAEVQLQASAGVAAVSVPASDLLLDTASADPAKHRLWATPFQAGPPLVRRTGPASATNFLVPVADQGLPAAAGKRARLARCANKPAVVYLVVASSATIPSTSGPPKVVDVATLFRTDGAPAGDAAPPATKWTTVTVPSPGGKGLSQLGYNLVLEVHPKFENTVYFGEVNLWRTSTGGVQQQGSAGAWQLCGATGRDIHADQHALVIDPRFGSAGSFDAIRLWAGNDGGVYRSTDGGTSFSHRNRDLQTLQFFQVASHPTARTVLLAGAQDNGTLRFDGSGNWAEVAGGDGCYVGIDPGEPATWYEGYVSYTETASVRDPDGFQGIQRSTSAGRIDTFTVVAGPSARKAGTTDSIDPNDDALVFAPFVIFPAAGAHGEVWVGTDRLYRSGDRGDHWQQVGPVLTPRPAGASPSRGDRGVSCVAFAPDHPERIYVGTSGCRLFRLDRAGNVWPTGGGGVTRTELTTPGGSLTGDATLVSDIAVARLGAHDRVVVALGFNHAGSGAVHSVPAVTLMISEDDGDHFSPLVVDTLSFPDGSTLDGKLNYANALAIDPQHTDVVYIGCNVGVFRFEVGVDAKPLAWNQGLPNGLPILDLDIWPRNGTGTPRLIRAATHGRGMYEAELDATAARTADVYVRDHLLDDGRDVPPATAPDPFVPNGTLHANASPDIKIESDYVPGGKPARRSTLDYTPTGPLDFIGFAQLREGQLVGGRSSTVWVQVHNRGPQRATNVQVRAYWAHHSGGAYPPLPAGFWNGFPTSDPPATDWKPLGPAVTIPVVRPGEPALASWSWDVTRLNSAILVAVTSAEDAFAVPGGATPITDPAEAARQSKFVALRDVSTHFSEGLKAFIVLSIMGLVAVGGYEALEHL